MAAAIFLTALLLASAAAVRSGTKLDRMTAAALVLAAFASVVAERFVPGTFSSPELGVAGVDLALLGFLVWVMARSDKFWPIWAVGLHAISVATHLAVLAAPDYLSMPYAIYSQWWGVPVALALFAGCFEKPPRPRPAAIRS